MRGCGHSVFRGVLLPLVLAMLAPSAGAFTITFDYSLDSNNFFSPGSDARASLVAAGGFYDSILIDDFTAISPAAAWGAPSGNQWQAQFTNPSTGLAATSDFLFVPADTILVYVGAYDLGGTQLGEAGYGGYAAAGTAGWLDTLAKRGESAETTGPTATEFAPWGGNLTVDIDSVWNLDHTIAPSGGQNDLYSVLLHELGHILGLGTAVSWDNLINTVPNPDTFTGAASVAEFGGPINLDGATGNDHWQNGTMSRQYLGGPAQEAALDPSITVGTRKVVTDLDVAGLDDIGWDITPAPEPSSALLAAVAVALVLFRRSRRGFPA